MITLRTLGLLEITSDDSNAAASVLAQPRRTALLCYLALALPRGFHRRDTLLALFWPECDTDQARHALRQSVYFLRRALGPKTIVSRGDEELALAVDQIECDVWAFDAAVEQGRPADAVALYGGELLAAFHISAAPAFEHWLDQERSRLRQQAGDAGWALAAVREREGDAAGAAEAARRAANLSPADETALRRLLLLLERVGDRTGAVRAYEDFAWKLKEEYELDPSAETEALAARIRTQSKVRQVAGSHYESGVRPSTSHSQGADTGRRVAILMAALAVRAPDAERRANHAAGQHGAQSRRILIITAGVLALVLATVTWSLRGGDGQWLRDRTAGPADRGTQHLATIAVLPFENLGPPADAYFAAGMSDEITSRLGSVKALGLVPRRAAQRHVRADMTMQEIGQELGVDYLLLGSVRWAGSDTTSRNVRITLELLRARDERQLWSSTYDRAIDNLFEVQSDIAEQVIQRLGVGLPEGGRSRAGYHPTENREAYLLYLKGRYFWGKRTEEDIETGLTYFQQATDLDPTYARAWAGIADIWIFRGWYSRLVPRETFPKALAAVQRALALDSTLAEAHASLAHIHLEFDHDWAAAEQEYLRAIALDPSYPTAHHWYGGYLSAMGRHDEALQQAETARSLDPMSLIIQTWMGLRYYLARNNEKAIAEYLKALALNPDFAPAHWHLGWAYEEAGRFKEAISEAERAVALDQGNLVYLSSLGHAYASAGMKKEAREVLAQLEEASTSRHVSAYHTAAIHVALGDTAAALDWLARAYDEQSPWIGYLAVDPRFDPVRSQPHFKEILRKARLM